MEDVVKTITGVDLKEVSAQWDKVEVQLPAQVELGTTAEVPFERPPEQQAVWAALVADLRANHNLTSDSTLVGDLKNCSLRIEAGFTFAKEAQDDDFHPLHVEPLLDQAADLLDRCLRDRATYDELAAKSFNQLLELFEYSELDAIHLEEEQEGVYDVTGVVSTSQYRADRTRSTGLLQGVNALNQLIAMRYTSDKIDALSGAEQLSAWLQGLVPYYWQGQSWGGYGEATWNGVKKALHDHYYDAGVVRSHHSVLTEYAQVLLQRYDLQVAQATSAAIEAGSQAQSNWDRKNGSFLRRRTLVARRYQDIRMKAATAADGVLNYYVSETPQPSEKRGLTT